MYVCIHTHIHTCTHTHIHTYRVYHSAWCAIVALMPRTNMYIHTYTYIHKYIHTYMHTYRVYHSAWCAIVALMPRSNMYIHTYIHKCIHTYMHTGSITQHGVPSWPSCPEQTAASALATSHYGSMSLPPLLSGRTCSLRYCRMIRDQRGGTPQTQTLLLRSRTQTQTLLVRSRTQTQTQPQ